MVIVISSGIDNFEIKSPINQWLFAPNKYLSSSNYVIFGKTQTIHLLDNRML